MRLLRYIVIFTRSTCENYDIIFTYVFNINIPYYHCHIFQVIISTVVLTSALEPAANIEQADDKVKEIISKYLALVPDIEEQYVTDERLSRAISNYFKGKISSFPLYKVSVKIDRNPVKIPWTLSEPNSVALKPRALKKQNNQIKRYKLEKIAKQDTGAVLHQGN